MNASDNGTAPTRQNSPDPVAHVWLGGNDAETRRRMELRLAGTVRPPTGPLDAAFVTPRSVEEAVHFATKLHDRLRPGATLTVIFMETAEELHEDAIATPQLLAALELAGYQHVDVSRIEESLMAVRFTLHAGEIQ